MHPQGADRQSTQTWAHLASLDPTLAKSLAEARTSTARSRRRLAVLPNIDDRSIFKLFFFFAMDFVSTETAPKKNQCEINATTGLPPCSRVSGDEPRWPKAGAESKSSRSSRFLPLGSQKKPRASALLHASKSLVWPGLGGGKISEQPAWELAPQMPRLPLFGGFFFSLRLCRWPLPLS